jgi:transcriptional regulator with XRE-family HTH domain
MALRGDRIQALRKARGLSVRQLAAETRIRHPTIYDIEAGRPANIGVDSLVRLARFFGVEPGYLLDATGIEENESVPALTL